MLSISETESGIKISLPNNSPTTTKTLFMCPYCSKSFTKKYTHKRHHTGNRCKKTTTPGVSPEPIENTNEVQPIKKLKPVKSDHPVSDKVDTDNDTGNDADDENETDDIDKLKEEVLTLYRNDPDGLKKGSDNELIKLVDKMDEKTLKMKIAQKRLMIGAKLNGSMTQTVLMGANQFIGKIFKCSEGLNKTTMKDAILKESCDDLLSYYLLDSIPVTIRLALLYGSHVVTNIVEANNKRLAENNNNNNNIMINTPEPPPVTTNSIPKPIPIEPFKPVNIPIKPIKYKKIEYSSDTMVSDNIEIF